MSNKNSTVVVDAKLLHLVRKLGSSQHPTSRKAPGSNMGAAVASWSSASSARTTDRIVAMLHTQHREYQRKDETKLRQAVQQAIRQIERQQQECGKSRSDEDLDDDSDYDRAAAQHDAVAQQSTAHGLNASLRNRYQQTAAAAASASSSTDQNTTTQKGNGNPSKSSSCGTPSTAGEEAASATNSNHGTGAPPSGKRRKLKRSSSRRGSSSELGGTAGTSQEKNNNNGMMQQQQQQPSWQPRQPRPRERYADLGGLSSIVQTVRQLVEYPITRPELYRHLGVEPPRGVLLRGPPGT